MRNTNLNYFIFNFGNEEKSFKHVSGGPISWTVDSDNPKANVQCYSLFKMKRIEIQFRRFRRAL